MQRCRISPQFSTPVTEKIIQAKRVGLNDCASAKQAGITPRTLYRWLARGREGYRDYQAFFHAYYDAELDGWNRQLAANRSMHT